MLLREYSAGALATLVIVGGLFLSMDYALSLPTVVESYETGVCVEVENYPGILFNQESYSCENMPSKFYHVWAE
jgi:hypothetical protein